jgi:hypothetical protein
MNTFMLFFVPMVTCFFDQVSMFFASLSSEATLWIVAGSGVVLAFAAAFSRDDIPEAVFTNVKKWHGKIKEQFENVDNAAEVIGVYAQSGWNIPPAMSAKLKTYADRLRVLIGRCDHDHASRADRMERDSVLKEAVSYCLLQVRMLVYHQFAEGNMTLDDVHLLRFLMPGETAGRRERSEETNAEAEVKAHPVSANEVRIVIDQAAATNAGQVVHGWPKGIRHALLIITTKEGEEVYREITTSLHNNVSMPEGSHGKMFLVKASFLKHVNDTPRFRQEDTFTMPYMVEDIASLVSKMHEEDAENHRLEVERLEAEIRRLSKQG